MQKNEEKIIIERNMLERIKEIDVNNSNFNDIVILISMLQKENGTFDLLSREDIPNDIMSDYCNEPTYICTSLYIKALINDEEWFINNIGIERLKEALNICYKLDFLGHGYESLGVQLKTMKMFIKNGLKDFITKYPDLNEDFTTMINAILLNYKVRKENNDFCFGFDNYEKKIKEVIELYEI